MNSIIKTLKINKVGLIRLNRPEVHNALNDELMNAITTALDDFEKDENINCVIITGSETVFAAGADIASMREWDYMDVYKTNFITRNWERLKTFRKPVIASVSGLAVGGGCELAMMCDIVFAGESAKFSLPEIKLALIPGAGGTQRLPRAIGKAKAMDLCLTGRFMSAIEAEKCGLISRIYPDDEVFDNALITATEISNYSLPVLMMLKESINRSSESTLNEGLLFERRTLHAAFSLQDPKEGLQAFIDKRKPIFVNK